MEEGGEGLIARSRYAAIPLAVLLILVSMNYLINGLPYIPDSWVHLQHSRVVLNTGYLFGPSPNPSRVSYNYQWPTVNLLLALSQSILGLKPLQSFYVVSTLASLSVIPFTLLAIRLTNNERAGVIAGLLFAVLSVKILVDSSVMKETAAQYPFYAFILATYIALTSRERFGENLVVMVLAFTAILFAHHFTLLMALAYSFFMSLTVLTHDYLRLGKVIRGFTVTGVVVGLGLLTYLWYMDYLRAFEVTSFVTPSLVSIPILITILLLDYAAMRRGTRLTIYLVLTLIATALISLFAVGLLRPYVLQGFSETVVLTSIPYVLPILASALYIALRGFEKPVVTVLSILSLAMIIYVLLMGNTPLELLFLSKTLDYAMPFLVIPTALLVALVVGRGWLGRLVGSLMLAVLLASLPLFALLTLFTYSIPSSSTLVVYRLVDYYELSIPLHLVNASGVYAPTAIGTMIYYMSGINASDPVQYLLRGLQPPGLLLLRNRDLSVGFLYGGGYGMVSIPRDYLLNTLSREDLVYSSSNVRAWLAINQ